jgi:hypothetical protein
VLGREADQRGARKMTTEHQATREEEAYGRLLEEIWERLSEPARVVFGTAEWAAYSDHMQRNIGFGSPEDYDEALEEMRLAAAKITAHEHNLLTKLWRTALAAAASIDPDDTTPVRHKADRGDLHYYYRTLSSMVEKILQEKWLAELQKERAEREPVDLSNTPFYREVGECPVIWRIRTLSF